VQPRLGAIIDQVVTLVTAAMPCISYGMLALAQLLTHRTPACSIGATSTS